jgi:hypothetical protein
MLIFSSKVDHTAFSGIGAWADNDPKSASESRFTDEIDLTNNNHEERSNKKFERSQKLESNVPPAVERYLEEPCYESGCPVMLWLGERETATKKEPEEKSG